MVDSINAATPVTNTFHSVENNDNSQNNQEEISNVPTEETEHMDSAQRDNEANANASAGQGEFRGTIVDILG